MKHILFLFICLFFYPTLSFGSIILKANGGHDIGVGILVGLFAVIAGWIYNTIKDKNKK
ncbi:hypothetical protein [Dysgonomonas sp. 520]|uniref:hypothetical protein n=1 Tax=Dysgonomonas sp. 520 TaxID=2302931 RepID=UPI0013D21DA2|nr:hypothetical protein [Dysgonomonas sp. 520]